MYRSSELESLWTYGYSSIGSVSFESAAYVARYVLKKVNGDLADKHYLSDKFDPSTGEIYRLTPEYVTMSRGSKILGTGGIGKGWFDKYKGDVYPHDFVVVRDRKMRPPKFYDNCYEAVFPDDYVKLKSKRKRDVKKFADDNTPERLAVKEECRRLSVSRLVRNVDKDN